MLRGEQEADELFDLDADLRKRLNVLDAQPEVALRLACSFGSTYFHQEQAPVRLERLQETYEVSFGSVE